MLISKGVEIIDGLPILYLKKISAIACTDLHLGYEGVMADKGTFAPKANLNGIKSILKEAVERTSANAVIVDGDIKNEFSKVHFEEFNEFRDFIIYLKKDLGIDRVVLIKGNHDNFIDRLKEPLGVELFSQEALISEFLFFHGEKLPASKEGRMLIMGHLHPAISFHNSLGVREKLKCFLHGKLKDGREIIVMPSMNYYAEGMSVNIEDVSEASPIFGKMLNINNMEALCLGEDETLNFGKISELRALWNSSSNSR